MKRGRKDVFKLFSESGYYEKISKHSKEIARNLDFQKELKELKKKRPLLKNQKEYLDYIKKIDKIARARGNKEGYVYFKEWHDFCDKWKIDYYALVHFNKVRIRNTLTVTKADNKDGKPGISIKAITDSDAIIERDWIDHVSLAKYIREGCYGKVNPGPKLKTGRDRAMRKEFKSRKDEDRDQVISDIANKQTPKLSFDRTRQIVRSKKYD